MNFENYKDSFENQIESIDKVTRTPLEVRDMAVTLVKGFEDKDLKNTGKDQKETCLQALLNIGEESLQSNFKAVYNQSCVLAVSALEASLREVLLDI